MAFIGFIITCSLLLCLFLYYKWSGGSGSKDSGKRFLVNDPGAQAVYENAKHTDEDKKLSLKEKIELSWHFLYEITETVLNKFSQTYTDQVKEAGETLVKNGVKYQHVVDAASVNQALSKTRNVNIEQEKKTTHGISI